MLVLCPNRGGCARPTRRDLPHDQRSPMAATGEENDDCDTRRSERRRLWWWRRQSKKMVPEAGRQSGATEPDLPEPRRRGSTSIVAHQRRGATHAGCRGSLELSRWSPTARQRGDDHARSEAPAEEGGGGLAPEEGTKAEARR